MRGLPDHGLLSEPSSDPEPMAMPTSNEFSSATAVGNNRPIGPAAPEFISAFEGARHADDAVRRRQKSYLNRRTPLHAEW